MVVGVFEEAGVHLHLASEHRLEIVGHVVPTRDLVGSFGQLRVGRDDPEFDLSSEGPVALRVPSVVETALVLRRPLLGHMVGGVRGSGRPVHEERLVRHQHLLLADPLDRVVGHVLGEVVALLRGPVRFDRNGVVVDRRVVLVGLAADESVEVFEPAPGRPLPERPHRAGLPDRHLVALAELGGRVAVELEHLGERRRAVRSHRVVARRGGRHLGDRTHADRVMVPAGQDRLPRRRAQRCRVEPVVPQTSSSEPIGGRGVDRATERGRRTESAVVDQRDDHVRCPGRWPQRLDRREPAPGVGGVVLETAGRHMVGHREHGASRCRFGRHRPTIGGDDDGEFGAQSATL